MTHIIFKSIRVVNPDTNYDQISDVTVKDGKILSIIKL